MSEKTDSDPRPGGQTVEPEAVGDVDPDADLESLSDTELRRLVDGLKVSPDRRPDRILRLFAGLGVLEQRGLLARPGRCELADVPAVKPDRSRVSARRRFLRLLRRIERDASPRHAEALAEWLAVDFVSSGLISRLRTIAHAVRQGIVAPEVVKEAYAAARRPGVARPAALFIWFVSQHSQGLARARAVR